MKLLFIGDVVGESGLSFLEKNVYRMKKELEIDVTVVNGENCACGNGINRTAYERLLRLGADVVTGGNHSFGQRGCEPLYDESEFLLRPANYPEGVPGKGVCILDLGRTRVAVINLMGVVGLEPIDNPFLCADRIISELDTPNIFVDFHAEATSEKKAMGQYLDGRVTAVMGTHTHVQTADETILPKKTAYITDVGMTGPELSVLGIDTKLATDKLIYHIPNTFRISENRPFLNAVTVIFDEALGNSHKIQRIIVR